MTNNAASLERARIPKQKPKTPLWAKILLVFFVLLLMGLSLFAGLTMGKLLGASETRDTQVIRSITREQQVVLLTAGVADVAEERGEGFNVLGLFDLPGSERALLVRYEYDAKLGIDGEDVTIEKTGDNAYLVSIPELSFLGYDNPDVSVAKEESGILSWTTPEIDKFDLVEKVVTKEAVASTVEGARPVLEEQAGVFYTNIVTAIDPAITLKFKFAGVQGDE